MPRQLLLFETPPPPDPGALFDELNALLFGGELSAEVEWSNRLTASAGTCDPVRRRIRLSTRYHERRPEALRITLAHEMLHLVVPDHGPRFRKLGRVIAQKLGTTWEDFRYAERWADLSRYRYVYSCPGCGFELASRKRRRVSCGRCGPQRFDERFRLVLSESRARPGPVLLSRRPVRGDRNNP
jgi:predicted SprT family Zn-dependent metalloprotease